MAFQNVIDALSSTIHRDTISNPMVEQINQPFRDSIELFEYQLHPRALKFLNESGIDATQFGAKTHPHPFHKSVELHILHNVWPRFSDSDSGVMFMKESKFNKIRNKNKSFKKVWNYKFAGKDAVRYKGFATTVPDAKTLFMHDAIMYFTREQILGLFTICDKLERLFATLVVPPESDMCDLSFYPLLYKFQREKDRGKLIYQPENHASGSYRQPIEAIEWLKTSKIEGPEFSLKISILESWGPVHHLMIEKSAAPGDEDYDSVVFKTPECIALPNPVSVDQDLRDRLVPTKVYNSCFSYVRSVRTLRETDPAGYIRTQMNKDEHDWVTSSAWDNLQSFILRTAADKPCQNYALYRSPIALFLSKISVHSSKVGWITAALSGLLGYSTVNLISKIKRSNIVSLSMIWQWIKKPQRKWFQLVDPNPSFYSMKLKPKRKFLLGLESLNSLCDEYPGIFNRFQPQEEHGAFKIIKIAALLLPLLAQSWSWFSGKYAPQQLDMLYQSFFHPKPWLLKLNRKPVRISPSSFFPESVSVKPGNEIKPFDDKFAPHPKTIEEAAERIVPSFSDNQEEENQEKEYEEEEVKKTKEEEKEEKQDEDEEAPLDASNNEDNQKEENGEHLVDQQEAQLFSSPELNKEEERENDTSSESDAKFPQAEAPQHNPVLAGQSRNSRTKSRARQNAPRKLSIRKTEDLNCGVSKYVVSCIDLNLGGFQPQSLRGREVLFFAKRSMRYGHDAVVYHNFGWPKEVAVLAEFLSKEFATEFNSALVNIYPDGGGIPWHSDDEICYDDADPILTLNIQGECFFNTSHSKGQKCNRAMLTVGDLLVMPPNFQKSHRHSVDGTVNSRSSVTFRHQKFSVPVSKQGVEVKIEDSDKRKVGGQFKKWLPKAVRREDETEVDSSGCIKSQPDNEGEIDECRRALLSDPSAIGPVVPLNQIMKSNFIENTAAFLTRERNGNSPHPKKPSQSCLLKAFGDRMGISEEDLWRALCRHLPNCQLSNEEIRRQGLTTDHLTVLGAIYDVKVALHSERGVFEFGVNNPKQTIHINHTPERGNLPGHFFAGGRVLQKKREKRTKSGDLIYNLLRFNISGELLPFKKVHDYESNVKRAKNLISNMKNGFDGVMANVEPLYPSKARDQFLALDLIMDAAVPRNVKIIHLAGFAGCGKSYPVQQLLKTDSFKHHKIAVPTVELRGEWKEAMSYRETEKWRVSTWESSMLKNARVLVIDEIYKMPRGYLDLSIHADSSIELVIILGDPIQGEYHSTHHSSNNKLLESEISYLKPYIDCYCLWSRRIPQNVANFFGVKSFNSFAGVKKYVPGLPSDVPILCNSVVSAKMLADMGHYSTTISASQGSTHDTPVAILLDNNSNMLNKSVSLVALTRSRKGVIFTGDKKKLFKDANCNHIFADFWHGNKAPVTELFQKTFSDLSIISEPITKRDQKFSGKGSARTARRRRNKIRMKDSLSVKKSIKNPNIDPDSLADVIVFRNEEITGDGSLNAPQISTHFLPETRRPLHFDFSSALPSDPKPMEVSYSPCAGTHVYPGEHFETLAALLTPNHDPEIKEIVFKDERSNQFPLLNVGFELGALPASLVAPIHRSSTDSTLLPASIEKRLRFRPSEAPYEITPKDELLGSMLYKSLCQVYKRNPNHSEQFDSNLYAECINANEYAQLSNKTRAFIASNASRSDPDWRYTVVKIFSKTQQKVNEHTIFGDWKACQTLALMHDAVILLLGPVKKYQRIFDKRDRPSNIYIHAGHTPFEMSEWCKENLSDSEHLSNDYSAFDQSQHGEAVVLEKKKMERLNIPEELINLHVWLKLNVQTQFGPLTCMRLTGEPGTYDDNTDYNLAVLNSEYIIGKTPTMVSGDDSMLDHEPPPNPVWPYIAPLLHLRFKKEKSFNALFCGYYVGSKGACRSPLTLFAKLAIAVDDGSLWEKRLSYLTEFAVGHSLGEDMWQLIPEDQVQYQSANFDFFCRNCPREEKILLKLGEPDSSFLDVLYATGKHLSSSVFALMKTSVRKAFLRKRTEKSLFHDKESELSLKLLSELSFE